MNKLTKALSILAVTTVIGFFMTHTLLPTLLLDALAGIALFATFSTPSKNPDGTTQRGTSVEKGKRQRGRNGQITIGGVPVPPDIESSHFLVSGGTGTGKSVVLGGVLSTVRDRAHDRALIVDPGGEMMSRFWRDGDTILNPLDARSVPWSPFAEMASAHDADRLAKSMIPDAPSAGDSQQWQLYSQSLVAAVLERLRESGSATNADLLRVLTIDKSADIEELVAGLPASTLFDTGAAKMLSSVRGIIGSYLPAYRFLPPTADAFSFSVRWWVEDGTGWLWMPVRNDMMASMRPLVSAWIGEAISAALSLSPDPTRRLWLVLDELASLGRVQSLSDALTQGRKFGLACVAGLQTVAQLKEIYGQFGAQVLLSCFSSQLLLRAPDPDTARWCSDSIGQRHLIRKVSSESQNAGGGGKSESDQHAIEAAVLPSEMQNLAKLQGFLRLADAPAILRIRLKWVPRPAVAEPFISRRIATAQRPRDIRNSSDTGEWGA
jgi:type IV secretory pathway TraG/TraD family ATPase VirD4